MRIMLLISFWLQIALPFNKKNQKVLIEDTLNEYEAIWSITYKGYIHSQNEIKLPLKQIKQNTCTIFTII